MFIENTFYKPQCILKIDKHARMSSCKRLNAKKALSGRGAGRSTIVYVHVATECGRYLALVVVSSIFDVGLLHVRVFQRV